MKTRMLLFAIIGLLGWNAVAQTAAQWISQGTSDLANEDIADANSAFAQALAVSPTNEPANAYYAATRLLVLSSQPAGSNFLTRLGFPIPGRDIYDWHSAAPKDTNGLLLAPAGVNADEFTSQLRTNALPAIAGAISNLALIADTNFTLNLMSNETSIASMTVDYGDLKLIQAGLWGAEYLIYMLNAQNLDVELTALRAMQTNGTLSPGQVLADYPQLFTFATTNDLQNALAAFTNGINTYFIASDFIRARSTNEVRLFNYDEGVATEEGDFRLVLQDLKNSLLIGPQFLSVDPNLTVNMAAEFYDPASWRSLLPTFDGKSIELGSFPDLTFGGVVDGLSESKVESFFGAKFTMLPVGSAPELSASNTINLTFTTLNGHNYSLEGSTNLTSWRLLAYFTAPDVSSTLSEPYVRGPTSRFYRLRDDTGFLIFAGVVMDQTTGLPIAGAEIYSVWDGTTTYTDGNGQFYVATTLPSSSYEDELEISAAGYGTVENYYGNYSGNGLVSGLTIYLNVPPPNDNFANRTMLTGASASATGNNIGSTVESGEPDDYYGRPGGKSVWFSWTAPASGQYSFSVSTTTVYSPILALYTGTQLSSLDQIADVIGSGYYSYVPISTVAGQVIQIEVDDPEGQGGPYTLNIVGP